MRPGIAVLLTLLFLPTVAAPQIADIVGHTQRGSRESLEVSTVRIVRISLKSGQQALIQFVKLTDTRADYRWRYKRNASSPVEVGEGFAVEKYERFPSREGRGNDVLPLPGHDPIIRAGEIRAKWSAGRDGSGYLYFNPELARVSTEPAANFEKGP